MAFSDYLHLVFGLRQANWTLANEAQGSFRVVLVSKDLQFNDDRNQPNLILGRMLSTQFWP